MKCPSCQGEWTSPKNISLSKCPFCQTDLLTALNTPEKHLPTEEILKNLITIYGNEVLLQEQRLTALIADLFAHDIKTKKLLALSIKEKVPQQMAGLVENGNRDLKLNEIETTLKEEGILENKAIEQLLHCWRLAIGWEKQEETFEIVWKRGYCGFRNSKGEMITPFKYDYAENFSDGLALVKQNNKYGFINKEGVEQLQLINSKALKFSDGLAYVETTKINVRYDWVFDDELVRNFDEIVRSFYINTYGEVVFELSDKYYWNSFFQGLASVYNKDAKKYGYINNKGELVIDFEYKTAGYFKDGIALVAKDEKYGSNEYINFGFINKKGIEVIPTIYKKAKEFSEGLAAVELNGKWGFINKIGKIVIELKYGYAHSFSNGLARVYLDGNWGFIDKNDEVKIPFIFKEAGNFKDGTAFVKKDYYQGRINIEGQIVTDFLYSGLLNFKYGISCARHKNLNKYGLINDKGEQLTEFKYDRFVGTNTDMWGDVTELDFRDGLMLVEMNDKYGFLDINGEEVIPLIYDGAELSDDGLLSVTLNGNSFYINKKGEKIASHEYNFSDSYIDFNEGLSIVKSLNSGRYGFIDHEWKEVIPLIYEQVCNFREGLALVKMNGKWGYINKQGRIVIPLRFDDAKTFKNGLATVKNADKFGIIDKTGHLIVPVIYNTIQKYHNGLARLNFNGKWGFVDIAGKIVIPIIYESVSNFYANIALACHEGKWGAISVVGEVLIEYQFKWERDCREFAEIQFNINGNCFITSEIRYWETYVFNDTWKE